MTQIERTRGTALAGFLALGLCLAGCPGPGEGAGGNSPGKKKDRAYAVRTALVTVRPLKYQIEASGELEAQDVCHVDAQVPGTVTLAETAPGVVFEPGFVVTPQTVLARISYETYDLAARKAEASVRRAETDHKKTQADLKRTRADQEDTLRRAQTAFESAKVRVVDAERELERRKPAMASGAVTQGELDACQTKLDLARVEREDAEKALVTLKQVAEALVGAAEAAVTAADAAIREKEADLAVARDNLRNCVCYAPVAGRVEKRLVSNGTVVVPGTSTLAWIADQRALKLRFQVPEREASFVNENMRVAFRVMAYPNRDLYANVYRVGDLSDPKGRLVTCYARVEMPAGTDGAEAPRLKSGYFAKVKLLSEQKQRAVVVPLTAPLPSEFGFVVYVVADGKAQRRKVGLGLQVSDQHIEILSGLQEGERIVVEGANTLLDGVAVKEQEPEPAANAPAPSVAGDKK